MTIEMSKSASIVARMNATVRNMAKAEDAQEKSAIQVRTFQAELGGELLELSGIETQAVVIVRTQDSYAQAKRDRTIDQRFVNRLCGYHTLVEHNRAFLEHGENVWQSYLPLFSELKKSVTGGKAPMFKNSELWTKLASFTAAQILSTQATTAAWQAFTGETTTAKAPVFNPAKEGETIAQRIDTSTFTAEHVIKQFKEMFGKFNPQQRAAALEALTQMNETPAPEVPANQKQPRKQRQTA